MAQGQYLKLAATNDEAQLARRALAEAIKRHKDALEANAAREKAFSDLQRRKWSLDTKVEKAKEAIEESKRLMADHLVNVVLGENDEAPKTTKELRLELQSLEDEFEATAAALETLKAGAPNYERDVTFCRYALDERIKDLLKVEPAVARLFDEFNAVGRRMCALRNIIAVLPSDVRPRHWDLIDTEMEMSGRDDAANWAEAIKALREDAQTALPEKI